MRKTIFYIGFLALIAVCASLLAMNGRLRTQNAELVAANQRLGHIDALVAEKIQESMALRCIKH